MSQDSTKMAAVVEWVDSIDDDPATVPEEEEPGATITHESEPSTPPLTYPYRAEGKWTYDADPADPAEISFVKHEILEVATIDANWWSVRKDNGEIGIAPSNFLILMAGPAAAGCEDYSRAWAIRFVALNMGKVRSLKRQASSLLRDVRRASVASTKHRQSGVRNTLLYEGT